MLQRQPSLDSLLSECSLASVSTSATAPNLPGPGRTLGNVYDRGGAFVEKHINRLGQALGIAPSPRLAYEESSSERNETAPNLPGPGRTLGLIYDALGRILEERVNHAARKIGLGPDAALERIENHLGKLSHQEMAVATLVSKRKLVRDFRKILRYTKSDVHETQIRAIQCIINLSLADQTVRSILVQMRAIDYLTVFEPCASTYCEANYDPLLADSRKALLSLTDTRVHTVGQKLLNDGWGSNEWTDKHNTPYHEMVAFIREPDVAFIAFRYLIKQRDILEEMILSSEKYRRDFSEAVQMAVCYGYELEWPTVSDLSVMVLDKDLFNWDYGYAKEIDANESLMTAIKLCLLAPDKFESALDHLTNEMRYPEKSDFGFSYLFKWERLVHRHAVILSLGKDLVQEISNSTSSARIVCRYALHESDDLNAYLAKFIYACYDDIDPACRLIGVNPVVNHRTIYGMVSDMMNCYKRSLLTNPDTRFAMVRNLEILRTLDRYIWKIVRDSICSDTDFEQEVFAETVDLMRELDQRPHSALPTKKLYKRKRLNLMRRFDAVKGRHEFFEWYLPDNQASGADDGQAAVTIRKKPATWWPSFVSLEVDTRHTKSTVDHILSQEERLDIMCETVLLMDVPVGHSFSASGHNPIYAGIDSSGRELYLGLAILTSSSSAWRYCVVPEGTEYAVYWVNGKMKTTQHFKVFVLRFDPDDYPRKYLYQAHLFGGVDATGPVYWWDTKAHEERTRGIDFYSYWKEFLM